MRAKLLKLFSISPRLLPSSPFVPPVAQRRSSGRVSPEEFMTEANALIDSIEQDVQRLRNLDAALLASLIARLDALRRML